MRLIDATNAEAYLSERGHLAPREQVSIRELAGGVSNIVLLVEFPASSRAPFVLKQAREQLRVAQPWFCSPERIWREVEVLRAYGELIGEAESDGVLASVPELLFEDREQYTFAMTAADRHALPWKTRLLRGDEGQEIAKACGRWLAKMHARSWRQTALAERFGDRKFFDDLRVDPYYREIARVHPAIKPFISELLASLAINSLALVHGDFSPKNLLVTDHNILLIDFEVGHYGDPAFDLGFFLSHLVLKAIHLRETIDRSLALLFWNEYAARIRARISPLEWSALGQRAGDNLLACLLARIDGKSPVEYLRAADREMVRDKVLGAIDGGVRDVSSVVKSLTE